MTTAWINELGDKIEETTEQLKKTTDPQEIKELTHCLNTLRAQVFELTKTINAMMVAKNPSVADYNRERFNHVEKDDWKF